MAYQFFDISAKPNKDFLDNVDLVLNSNTFILPFNIRLNNVSDSLQLFLATDNFQNLMLQQDKDRGWNNMHYFDKAGQQKVKPGNLLKENFKLKCAGLIFIKVKTHFYNCSIIGKSYLVR